MNTKRAMVLFVIETTFWIASMLGIGLIMLGLMYKQVELLVGSLVFAIGCIGISVYLRRIVKKEMKEGQYQKIVIQEGEYFLDKFEKVKEEDGYSLYKHKKIFVFFFDADKTNEEQVKVAFKLLKKKKMSVEEVLAMRIIIFYLDESNKADKLAFEKMCRKHLYYMMSSIVITISDHYCYIPLFTEEDYDLSVSLTYWEMEKEAKKILGIK